MALVHSPMDLFGLSFDRCSEVSESFRCFRRQLAVWMSQRREKDHWPVQTVEEILSWLVFLHAILEIPEVSGSG